MGHQSRYSQAGRPAREWQIDPSREENRIDNPCERLIFEQSTRDWLERFVIAHDVCPFAGREHRRDAIRYAISERDHVEGWLHELAHECRLLDKEPDIATTLLIVPRGLEDFEAYLDLLDVAQALLDSLGYEGVYQLASFHPDYVFEGVEPDDPANFTNRSPWPMLHLLREAELTRALNHYPDPEAIPERNVARLRAPNSKALAAAMAATPDR